MATDMPPEGLPKVDVLHRRPGWSWTVVAVLAVVAAEAVFGFFKSNFRPPVGPRDVCLFNVWFTGVAVRLYTEDNDDRFPPPDGWSDRLDQYVKSGEVFRCPEAKGLNCAFAYNASLAGVSLADLADPEHTVLVFESDWGWNAAGGPELLPDEPRHFIDGVGGDNYCFADLGARWLPRQHNPDGTYAKEPEAEVRWEVEE